MKYLLITLGSIGDVLPFLAVADALRLRGHTVVIASHAGYAQLVQGSGFEFAIVSERPQQPLDDILEGDPDRAWEIVRQDVFVSATRPVRDFIAHHARLGPCRVIASWNAFGASLAKKELRVPLCRVFLSPHALAQTSAGSADERMGFFSVLVCSGNTQCSAARFCHGRRRACPRFATSGGVISRRWTKPDNFHTGQFHASGPKLLPGICGGMPGLGAAGDLPETLQRSGADGVAAHRPPFQVYFAAALGPPCRRISASRRYRDLCTGVAGRHHQLIKPVFFDQHDNSARIECLGVGQRIGTYWQPELAQRLTELLVSPTVRNNCALLRERFSGSNPLARICEAVGPHLTNHLLSAFCPSCLAKVTVTQLPTAGRERCGHLPSSGRLNDNRTSARPAERIVRHDHEDTSNFFGTVGCHARWIN